MVFSPLFKKKKKNAVIPVCNNNIALPMLITEMWKHCNISKKKSDR